MARVLRVGTRKSALAKWQAEMVADRIRSQEGAPDVEFVYITTEGDRLTEHPLHQLPGRSFFTKDIERALLDDRVDLAVHSLKDLATEFPAGLALGAVLEREDPRDVIVGAEGFSLDEVPAGTTIGTSSLRRKAFLANWRPDLKVVDIRGNVPTRAKLVEDGTVDAVIMAAAGLKRLGMEALITEYLPLDRFLPAAGQAAVAVQVRNRDEDTLSWVRHLEHAKTRSETDAERAFLNRLEGGCQVPVGAFATLDQDQLHLRGGAASLDGGTIIIEEASRAVTDAEGLGRDLADKVLDLGGNDILREIRKITDRR
ncbi:MAG: hydroxymethylbilane synthase [Gemmatimonadota bacterium]|nr:hydroxymethylbilane synthase [Gemmatimonadota bacterium]